MDTPPTNGKWKRWNRNSEDAQQLLADIRAGKINDETPAAQAQMSRDQYAEYNPKSFATTLKRYLDKQRDASEASEDLPKSKIPSKYKQHKTITCLFTHFLFVFALCRKI